mgnify:FL=1
MSATEAISLIGTIAAIAVGVGGIITFFSTRKDRAKKDGADTAIVNAKLDNIKSQNETIMLGNRNISDKIDSLNERVSRTEQTVADAHLSEIPPRIAALESSVKSAHHRIDEIQTKIDGRHL